ncbi:MAG: Crp/Fnr family transcriptional regulator [Deltaproteobacteria bacterium]|nr:Crp/Fnr family transcriptional regulator [Deltaproteobacteria bacterium]
MIELDAPEGVVILVKQGRVLATTVDQAGQETLCVLRDGGSVIGLEALSGMVLPYFLWTMTEVELAVAPANQGREWLRGQNQAVQAVVRATADSLRQLLNEQMALHGSAQTRLARLILNAVEGDKDCKGPATVMLTLPKNVLARMLQMRAETMSRVLKKLEAAGAIALTPKIEVRSTKKLAELIESRSSA